MSNEFVLKLRSVALVFGLSVLCYLFVFNVPFQALPFGTDKIVGFLAWVFLFVKLFNSKLAVRPSGSSMGLLALLVFILFYASGRSLFSGALIGAYPDVHIALISIPGAWALREWSKPLLRLSDRCNCPPVIVPLIGAGIIAALLSTVLVFHPEIMAAVRSDVLKWDLKSERLLEEGWLFRGYGISAELTFGYSLVQAFILILIVIFCRRRFLFLMAFVPAFLISVLYNARIGILVLPVFIVSLLFVGLFVRSGTQYSLKTLIVLAVGLVVMLLASPWLEKSADFSQYLDWAQTGFLSELGDSYGPATSSMLIQMAVLPSDWNPIVGNGILLNAQWDPAFQSDVGYTTQLYFGGLLYFIAWVVLLGSGFFLSFKNSKGPAEKVAVLTCAGFLIVANIKGDAIHSQTYFKIVALMIMARLPLSFKAINVTKSAEQTIQELRAAQNQVANDQP